MRTRSGISLEVMLKVWEWMKLPRKWTWREGLRRKPQGHHSAGTLEEREEPLESEGREGGIRESQELREH